MHRASVEGNVDTLLRALRYDIAVERVEAPTAALEFARRLAQHGVPVNALVHAYRLGQRRMNELVFREVRAIDPAPIRFAVLETITATLFEYIDSISQQVSRCTKRKGNGGWKTRTASWPAGPRAVDNHRAIDTDRRAPQFSIPCAGTISAMVMWYPERSVAGDELSRLQRFLREVGHEANASVTPLFVAADQTSGWAWLSYKSATPGAVATVRQFARGRRPNSPEPGDRHRPPRRRRIPSFSPQGGGGPGSGHRRRASRADDDICDGPGLPAAALLCCHMDAAREWVTDVLGNLAADSENDARLRDAAGLPALRLPLQNLPPKSSACISIP